MSGNNSTSNNSDWIRLNVGGKVFQTTKDTLSRYPESFLARLINGNLPSEKDESGAYLIDGDSEHFRTIMTYLRRGVLDLDGNEKTDKDQSCEADFYKIQPLIDKIQKAMRTGANRTEAATMIVKFVDGKRISATVFFSETQDDYEVLQALRDRTQLNFERVSQGEYITRSLTTERQIKIETALRGFGFVQDDNYDDNYDEYKDILGKVNKVKKFTRTNSK